MEDIPLKVSSVQPLDSGIVAILEVIPPKIDYHLVAVDLSTGIYLYAYHCA